MFDGRFDDRGRFVPGRRRGLRQRICSGTNFFQFTNLGNAKRDGSGPAFQPGGWTATTDGAIWISTGGATPVLEHAGPELPVGLPVHAHLPVGHADRGVPVEQRRC